MQATHGGDLILVTITGGNKQRMSDYFQSTPVDLDFLEQAKNLFRAEQILRAFAAHDVADPAHNADG